MRNFVLGVVITLLILALGGLAFALLGYSNQCRRDSSPPRDAHRHECSRRLHGPSRPAGDDPLPAHRRQPDRRHEDLHHELLRLPRHPRQQAQPACSIPSTRRRRKSFSSARRPRVAHLLRHLDGRPLHRNARLEQSSQRAGSLEGNRFSLSSRKASPAVQDYWKKAYGVSPQAAPSEMKEMDTGKGKEEKH